MARRTSGLRPRSSKRASLLKPSEFRGPKVPACVPANVSVLVLTLPRHHSGAHSAARIGSRSMRCNIGIHAIKSTYKGLTCRNLAGFDDEDRQFQHQQHQQKAAESAGLAEGGG